MPNSESAVLIFIVLIFLVWGYVLFKRWLYAPPRIRLPVFVEDQSAVKGELPDFLREAGYDVVYGKVRIPITFDVDGRIFKTRYYIDALAREKDQWYVVKTARPRQTLEWTGTGLRDKLLPYALLCQTAGVLFVDMEQRKIKKITYELD